MKSNETLDGLGWSTLKVFQGRQGYRFSIDPVILCDFARLNRSDRVLDLGTGNGVIPLLLAGRGWADKIVGVEIQPAMADRARRSVEENSLEKKIEIIQADLRSHRQIFQSHSFEAVLTNPPYRQAGTGRQAPDPERAKARHEFAGDLDDFLMAASYCLVDSGRFYIVYLAERLPELLAKMRQKCLEPKRLRCVHGRSGDPARMVLVEGRKGGRPGLDLEPPLFVFEGDDYSKEVRDIYGEADAGGQVL